MFPADAKSLSKAGEENDKRESHLYHLVEI
jgi:hypothetical protein